jgi:hypothetical protein
MAQCPIGPAESGQLTDRFAIIDAFWGAPGDRAITAPEVPLRGQAQIGCKRVRTRSVGWTFLENPWLAVPFQY